MKRKSECSLPYAKRVRKSNALARRSKISFGTVQRSLVYDFPILNGATVDLGIAVNSQTAQIGGTVVPFQGGGDISAMYDAYRIMKVRVEIMYNNNSSSVNQTTYTLPYISSAVDVDDVTTSSLANITQRDDYRCNNFGEGGGFKMIRTFVPKVSGLLYASSVASGYLEPKAYQWVSTGLNPTFTDPLHYGLKVLVEDGNESSTTGNNGYCRVLVKAYFEVKHAQ